jgi:hypothetical protein
MDKQHEHVQDTWSQNARNLEPQGAQIVYV